MNPGTQKSTFSISVVVNFLDWSFHPAVVDFLRLSFEIILFILIIEVLPLSNRNRKLLNFFLPLKVRIQPYNIGEKWLFLGFAHFIGFKIFLITLHSLLLPNMIFLYVTYGLPYSAWGVNHSHRPRHLKDCLYLCDQYTQIYLSKAIFSGSWFLLLYFSKG